MIGNTRPRVARSMRRGRTFFCSIHGTTSVAEYQAHLPGRDSSHDNCQQSSTENQLTRPGPVPRPIRRLMLPGNEQEFDPGNRTSLVLVHRIHFNHSLYSRYLSGFCDSYNFSRASPAFLRTIGMFPIACFCHLIASSNLPNSA